MRKKKYINKKIILFSTMLLVVVLSITCFSIQNINKVIYDKEIMEQSNTSLENTVAKSNETEKDYIYLSDLDYITANNWSYNGWSGHTIQKDKNPDGGTIRVKVDDKAKIFLKGLGIHATGQVTYDVSSFSKQYTRFIAIVGVEATKTANSDLGITVSISDDGQNWTNLFQQNHIRAGSNGFKVDVDITNATFLRIFVDAHRK